MKSRLWTFFTTLALVCVFALAVQTSASAQARGGTGMASGMPAAGGYGMGRGADMSRGRVDDGLVRARERPNERPDPAREIARIQGENVRHAERDLREHPEVAPFLNTTTEVLRAGYRRELIRNPTLTFGRYVLLTRLAANLKATHQHVTREELLVGVAEGKSVERTLRSLGLDREEAKEARQRAEREVKETMRRS